MSQRGPASQPASRRTSISPVGNETGSPTTAPYTAQPGSGHGQHGSAHTSHTNGMFRSQQIPPRTLGVHTILNPSDANQMAPEDARPPGVRPLSHTEAMTTGPPTGAFGAPFFTGEPVSRSQPGTPVGLAMPLGRPSSAERLSPPGSYRTSALNNPRKILSPKPPRAASLSHGPPRDPGLRQSPFLPTSSPAKRSFEPDAPEEPRMHIPGIRHQPEAPFAATSPMTTPPRSLSQPSISRLPGGPHGPQLSGHPPPGPPPAPQREFQGRPPALTAQAQYQHGAPPMRSFSVPGMAGEGPPGWSDTSQRLGGAPTPTTEEPMYMTLPGSDAPIEVQVNTTQGSKKADEKRQRNASASTRHRRKKKTQLEEKERELSELKEQRQAMIRDVEDLSQQRDFYRTERNRLRDIVSRTPGISEHAAGPASPPARMLTSFLEASPVPTAQSLGPGTPLGYTSETSMAERPAQRRRLDDRPEFTTPVYNALSGGQGPPTLPPMQAHGYHTPSRPSSASSMGSGERLPPLRAMDGPPPGQGLGPGYVHEHDPRTGQWVPAQPRQTETGWATGPRNPPDAPPR